MYKRVVTAIIDKTTGKITVEVDGFPHEECMNQAKKIGGKNAALKTENDIKPTVAKTHKNTIEIQSGEEVNEDEKHEQRQ